MRFKFLMMVFILFSLVLFPSRVVLALNGTVTTQPDQNRQYIRYHLSELKE